MKHREKLSFNEVFCLLVVIYFFSHRKFSEALDVSNLMFHPKDLYYFGINNARKGKDKKEIIIR